MESPPTYFHGNSTDTIKVGTNNPPLEITINNISEGGSRSSGYESKVKSRKKKEKEGIMHRYAFQTKSQVDILDDGYRWRKYGQKAVKNSKFPRSYYKCTHKAGCNVKKQIQRLSKDEEIVETTYEGMHTHPLENNVNSFEQILRQIQPCTPP